MNRAISGSIMSTKFLAGAMICAASFLNISNAAAEAENPLATAEYNGHCALGLSKGMDVQTDCSNNWQDPSTKRVYCFSSSAAKSAWIADPKGNLTRAETGFHAAVAKAQANAKASAAMKQAQDQMKDAHDKMKNAQGMMGTVPVPAPVTK